jgi:uncharacterized protein (DUF1800 family)
MFVKEKISRAEGGTMESLDSPTAEVLEALEAGPAPLVAAGALALTLAACSGAGTMVTPTPTSSTPTPTPTASATTAQASRFLAQATMGATSATISDVQTRGYDGWITSQFAMARATSHWDWLVARGFNVSTNSNNEAGFDSTMWRQMIVEPDQLRQRVAVALLEMMVVGIDGLTLNWKQFAMAAYVDLLLDNAFGNFRTILDKITTNAAMASYLTFLGNRKANAATGAQPDENYARELMQLFTLGLYRLNADGSQQLVGGAPVETYGPADVSGLARVFTGLTVDSADGTTPDRYRRPLIVNAAIHETGASSFLGASVPAGTSATAAVGIALDTIFAHPNVPPFVSKQLIQRLVTSNPSAAYVGRISAIFANNGSGVRGDMQAVIRAILMDSEARADPAGTSGGKLREPVMRLTGWARAFGAASASDLWAFGDTSSSSTRLAESMGRSSSVFNFFRPGYSPPNTAISAAGLVAPEFQITNELSVVAYVNYMQSVVSNTVSDIRAGYADLTAVVTDSQALADTANLLLAAGQVGSATAATIKAAIDSIASGTTAGNNNRIYIAVLLTLASPEYLALK